MWWLFLLFPLSSALTSPDTPYQFARKMILLSQTKKTPCSVQIGQSVQRRFDPRLGSVLESQHLQSTTSRTNAAYNPALEKASLPKFLQVKDKMPKPSIYSNLCLTMLDVASETAYNFSYTKCNLKKGQTCVFAMKLGEELPVFDAHCSDMSKVQGDTNCTRKEYTCWHNFYSGVYFGTGCCAKSGVAMIKSHLSQAFFSVGSSLGVDPVIKDSTRHSKKIIQRYPKETSATIRYSVFGVFLAVFLGIAVGLFFLYRRK